MVGDQVGVLPVHRDEQVRVGSLVEGQQLVGLAVPGGVHAQLAAVHQLDAPAGQGVVEAGHGSLVAGDGMRGEDHGVPVAHVEESVAAVGHALQGGPGLTLRAGAHHARGDRIQVLQLLVGGQHPVRDPQQA